MFWRCDWNQVLKLDLVMDLRLEVGLVLELGLEQELRLTLELEPELAEDGVEVQRKIVVVF